MKSRSLSDRAMVSLLKKKCPLRQKTGEDAQKDGRSSFPNGGGASVSGRTRWPVPRQESGRGCGSEDMQCRNEKIPSYSGGNNK
ncbi:hypothetical protein MASR1M66_14590 [Aminivibrio sp.]